MSALIEKLERLEKEFVVKARNNVSSIMKLTATTTAIGVHKAIEIVKQHSDWLDISVEPIKRTEFDSEAVLAIDVNGYTYIVTLADVVICGEKKREWTECKVKWNGEFWEAVEYICQSEKLVAYKYIPSPPSEVKP